MLSETSVLPRRARFERYSQKLDPGGRLRIVVDSSRSIKSRLLGHVAKRLAVESPARYKAISERREEWAGGGKKHQVMQSGVQLIPL